MAAVDPLGGRGVADLKDIVSLVEDDLVRVEELFEAQFQSDVGLVGEIGRYIREGGGKRIRPALLLLACRLCGYRGERAILLASVVEFIHTATLLHDDIIDEAITRRGRRSVNSRWGNDITVLLGRLPLHEVDVDGAVPGQPAHPAPALRRHPAHDRGRAAGDRGQRRPRGQRGPAHRHHPAEDRRPVLGLHVHRRACWARWARSACAPSPATGSTSASASRWWTTSWTSPPTRRCWASR